jgi:hypothetical protein
MGLGSSVIGSSGRGGRSFNSLSFEEHDIIEAIMSSTIENKKYFIFCSVIIFL